LIALAAVRGARAYDLDDRPVHLAPGDDSHLAVHGVYRYELDAFSGVTRVRGGAAEFALRCGTLDPGDGGVAGDRERDWTLGVNGYLTTHFQVQANSIRASRDRAGLALDPGSAELRLQRGSGRPMRHSAQAARRDGEWHDFRQALTDGMRAP